MSNFILNPICIQLSNPIDIRVALQELKQLLKQAIVSDTLSDFILKSIEMN